MTLEKLIVDEDSFILFACIDRNFFAMSLFSMIVSRSDMNNLESDSYFQYPTIHYSQTSQ